MLRIAAPVLSVCAGIGIVISAVAEEPVRVVKISEFIFASGDVWRVWVVFRAQNVIVRAR